MKAKLLLLVLTLQLGWALATVATQELRLHYAPTALLETAPVDPRDLLRGDFVILNYRISRLPLTLFQPPLAEPPPPGTTVYVTLAPRGEFHAAIAASLTRPDPAPDTLIVRGTTRSSWQPPTQRFDIDLTYGIERYYVPEGTGNPNGTLTARIVVGRSGNATLREVYINGRPYREVMAESR